MRCDECAKDIPKGQEVYSTKSEQVGPAGLYGAFTKTVQIALCPACVRKRSRREIWLWIAVLGFFLVGLLVLLQELSSYKGK